MDKKMEEQIRQIVREELAAHKERLDGEAISKALGKYLADKRRSSGESNHAFFGTPQQP